jgi:predicted dehydrogenase
VSGTVDKLRIGVIGAGGIARRRTIAAIQRGSTCAVVAVMNPSRSAGIAAEFGIPRAYEREEDLLADPAVEAVYIATPLHLHGAQIRAAARAGKHVLCEKPLALDLAEADAAIAACRAAGVVLQEGYMMPFHGAHRAAKALIDAGRLGKLVSLRAQLSCWYPRIAGAWRQDPAKSGGGALIDLATHLYGLLEHFAGPIRRLACFAGTLVQDYPCDDASTTMLEFASGAHATVDCFFCIPDQAVRSRREP